MNLKTREREKKTTDSDSLSMFQIEFYHNDVIKSWKEIWHYNTLPMAARTNTHVNTYTPGERIVWTQCSVWRILYV